MDSMAIHHPCAIKVSFTLRDWPSRLNVAWTVLLGRKVEVHVHAREIVVEKPTSEGGRDE